MEEVRNFKMAFGRGAYYSLVIGLIIELVMVGVFLKLMFWMGIGFLLLTLVLVWINLTCLRENHYEVSSSEIIIHLFCNAKKVYPIDRITKIRYVDEGTEWIQHLPNARFQLELFFEREFLKSVEPVNFAPEDRDGFVECLLSVNPQIAVEK